MYMTISAVTPAPWPRLWPEHVKRLLARARAPGPNVRLTVDDVLAVEEHLRVRIIGRRRKAGVLARVGHVEQRTKPVTRVLGGAVAVEVDEVLAAGALENVDHVLCVLLGAVDIAIVDGSLGELRVESGHANLAASTDAESAAVSGSGPDRHDVPNVRHGARRNHVRRHDDGRGAGVVVRNWLFGNDQQGW